MLTTQSLQRAAWLILTALFAALLCHSWYGPDIWYHLTWGRDLLTGSTWLPPQHTVIRQPVPSNPYWLFQILLYAAFEHGGILLGSFVFAATWTAVLVLWLNLSQVLSRPVVGNFLILGMLLSVQLRFEQRPEVFSYLFLLLTIQWILKKPNGSDSGREFAGLFLIQMLWTNMHSYFVLGPILCGAYVMAALLGWSANRRRAALALAVSLMASLATPFGWHNWASVLAYAQIGKRLRDFNAELFPPVLWPLYWPFTLYWFFFLLVGFLALRALWLRRLDFGWLVALGGMALSSQASRNIPLLMLMGAPLLATLPRPQVRPSAIRLSAALTMITSFVLIALIFNGTFHRSLGSLGSFGVRLEPSAYPIAATEFMKNQGVRGRIFTDSYDGGYVEYNLPDVQVAGDSYFSDPNLTIALFNATRDPSYLAQLHAQARFDAFLINIENLEIIETLLNDPNLSLSHTDSHRALFILKGQTSDYDNASIAARGDYYQGEDLQNWNNSIGVVTWSAIFRKHRWRQPMLKILNDIQSAARVPSALLKIAMHFAEETKDHEMAELSVRLIHKVHENEPGQRQEVLDMEQKLRACCF